jgi:Flp pilus assembly protein TadG
MAIVLPILLLLVFGIIEMSNAWRTHQVVTNVVREGARVAILPTVTEDSVRNVMLSKLTSQGMSAPDTIIVYCETTAADGLCSGTGQEASVKMDYPFRFTLLGPIVNLACGGSCGSGNFGSITIASKTVMRKE